MKIKNAEMEDDINRVTNMLMLDYSENKKIDQLMPYTHPDKETVISLIRHLMILVYPGYYRNKVYHGYTRRTNVQMILEDVVYNLIQQIKMTLPYLEDNKDLDDEALCELQLFAKRVARGLKKVCPCIKVAQAVIGVDVPHVHIHLVPLNKPSDLSRNFLSDLYSRVQSLSLYYFLPIDSTYLLHHL